MAGYECPFPFDCSEGAGNQVDVHIDAAISDIKLTIYVYYTGGIVYDDVLSPGEEKTVEITSRDGSYLTGKRRQLRVSGHDLSAHLIAYRKGLIS